jgi:hypothetical protein
MKNNMTEYSDITNYGSALFSLSQEFSIQCNISHVAGGRGLRASSKTER